MPLDEVNNPCQVCNDARVQGGVHGICVMCRSQIFPFNNLSDVEISELSSYDHPIQNQTRLDQIENQTFNPQLFNEIHNVIAFSDVDPDNNFYNNQLYNNLNCNYYYEDSFNAQLATNMNASLTFSLIHLNIRSGQRNLDKFETYMQNLDLKFDVVGLSETWFNVNNVDRYGIMGYSHEYNIRMTRKGGGVSLYIKNHISYKKRPDLDAICNSIETLFIEIGKNECNYNRNIVVGCIYRPPDSNLEQFLDNITHLFDTLNKENKVVYLIGDFNINLLNTNNHKITADFVELMFSYFYMPLINKPTRIKNDSATLIDNILCNDVMYMESNNGILCTDISDHFPVFSVMKAKREQANPEYIIKRIVNDVNIQKFKDKLSTIDWGNLIGNNGCQEAFSLFHSTFIRLYEECFPLKKIKISYRNRKSWLSLGLKNSIKVKNKLYIHYIKYKTDENKKSYLEYKRILNKLLRQGEREHYDNLFKENIGNIKKSWELIKEVINKSKNVKKDAEFIIDGKKENNSKLIANAFNQFYLDIGTKLSQTLPSVERSFASFMPAANPNSLFLRPASGIEVENIICDMKKKSPGWDGLSSVVIKDTLPYFIDTLTSLINLSMTEGVFPDELKIAKVVPIYKNNDTSIINNYRPVSILSVFSKVFEKIMYDRIIKFIDKHKLLYDFQFGFRKNYNTNLALITLVDKISKALDSGKNVVGVFLDFSKAFDTVNHDILLHKLNVYGIRGIALSWMESYLQNRVQYVNYNGEDSFKGNIKCGVPQGSVLGPLLYLLYVNDIVNVSRQTVPILFADDTNIFLEGDNIENVMDRMNLEMKNLVEWTIANKLSLNVEKTNYMIFSTKRKRVQTNSYIHINNKPLKRVDSTKFLGIMLDNQLSWKEHIKYILSKMSKGIGILCKARKVLKCSTLSTLYNCFLYPYITYGIEVWGNAYECTIKPIIMLQKRAVRIIVSANYRAHTAPIFKSLEILPLKDVYELSVAKLMFKIMKDLTPGFMKTMFTSNVRVHGHLTRQRHNLHVPIARTNIMSRTFRHRGVHIWNNIMNTMNLDCNFIVFKRHMKNYYITKLGNNN